MVKSDKYQIPNSNFITLFEIIMTQQYGKKGQKLNFQFQLYHLILGSHDTTRW